ncbi:GumC domain-containing protein [Planctobacterium marinum]|uniref:hypothetical protein n=1 Tax=Planctobacterium marinum TaxID=1631968 RepID=UPI001E49F64D|nr:hypothetical protein [Planctobacterium marinum]MCC2606147.1 hypothetical protein [Planctobacterium marinum]
MYVTLGDVFFVALKRWKLFLLFLIVGVAMTVVVSSVMKKNYTKHLLLVSPPQSVLEQIANQVGESVATINVLAQTKLIVESDVILGKFLDDYVVGSQEIENDFSDAHFMAQLLSNLSIEGKYEGSNDESTDELVALEIKLKWHDEHFAVNFLNQYTDFLNEQLRNYYQTEAIALINARIDAVELEIESLRTNARNHREFTIRRLTSENQEKIGKINRQLEILRVNTLRDIEQQISMISEARKIAAELGIEKPTPLEELNQPAGQKITNIKLTDNNTTLPLYLMGEKYLKALGESLESREDPLKYSEEAIKLLKEKEFIKNDPELENLKVRQSDDEFITEMASLTSKKQVLQQYVNVSMESIDLVKISRAARLSGVPDSPSKLMIALVGFVVSLILSFFLLIMIEVYKRTEIIQKD